MKSLFAVLFAASLTGNDLAIETTPAVTTEVSVISSAKPIPQKDPKATKILDAVSTTTKSRKTITLDFTFTVKNGDMKETQKGNLRIKGDKYELTAFGTTKISDGKSIAEVSEKDKEVTITSNDSNDPDQFSPQEMFTIYEKGYKYRHMGQKTENGVTLDLIDLYPDADNTQPYRRVTLFVNTETNEIKKIELFHKTSAKVFSVTVDKVTYDLEIAETDFNCEPDRWPEDKGWDVDDQRNAK